jgi:hypothetical protein
VTRLAANVAETCEQVRAEISGTLTPPLPLPVTAVATACVALAA